jgi:hypothetical protein
VEEEQVKQLVLLLTVVHERQAFKLELAPEVGAAA